MQEFSAISVSSYEAGSLADRLTEQSRDGWSVVAIVPTGSTITAYLSRESDGTTVAAAEPASEPAASTEPALAAAAAMAPAASEPAAEPAVEETPEPVAEPAVEVAPAAAADPAASTDTAAAGAAAASTASSTAGAAPAGWYADPSGRFELRYWDGGQWTEHVSRAGQQYTDPPVA